MPGETAIEWTRGDDGSRGATWNPVTGCTKVSAGCDRCYAERFAERFRGVQGHAYEQGFDLKLWPERLEIPLCWTRPRRVFVNSMSDLWHAGVPDQFIADVFAVMALAPQHTFMVLTKRPRRMAELMQKGAEENSQFRTMIRRAGWALAPKLCDREGSWPGWPLPNVWLGVSVEDQEAAYRVDWLAQTPSAVRFLSCEPLLGPVDLTPWLFPVRDIEVDAGGRMAAGLGGSLVDWVIAGGESGPGFRPIEPDWVRDLRDQCVLARVPFFFKQWGGLRSWTGGRELDGRTWDEFPVVTS